MTRLTLAFTLSLGPMAAFAHTGPFVTTAEMQGATPAGLAIGVPVGSDRLSTSCAMPQDDDAARPAVRLACAGH